MHSVLTISYAFPGLNLQCIPVSRAQADRQNMVQQQSLLENESLLTRKRKREISCCTFASFGGWGIFWRLAFHHAVARQTVGAIVLVCAHPGRGHVSTVTLSWGAKYEDQTFQVKHILPEVKRAKQVLTLITILRAWKTAAERVECLAYSWLQQRLFTEESKIALPSPHSKLSLGRELLRIQSCHLPNRLWLI